MLVNKEHYYSSVSFDDIPESEVSREFISVAELSKYYSSALAEVDRIFGQGFSKGVKVNPEVIYKFER